MLYQAYQAHSDVMIPVRKWAGAALRTVGLPLAGIADNAVLRNLTAAYELIARAGLTHARPAFGIDGVIVGNRETAVSERTALSTPFGTLLHFKKDIDTPQPRVLLVAPLSGHFATLLRSTVRTMLPEHDVYITDWHNVRDVPLMQGRFGFDDYIAHLIRFLDVIGPAISVRLSGVAGCASSDISATADKAETQGWQIAIRCAPGPITSRTRITCSVYSSRPKRPAASGTSRTLCQSVM